jgi:hypothetical protein
MAKEIKEMDKVSAKIAIQNMITKYVLDNPAEAKAFAWDIKRSREELGWNYSGMSKEKTMMFSVSIPKALLKRIEKSFPEIFRDRDQFRWFMAEFPFFRIKKG